MRGVGDLQSASVFAVAGTASEEHLLHHLRVGEQFFHKGFPGHCLVGQILPVLRAWAISAPLINLASSLSLARKDSRLFSRAFEASCSAALALASLAWAVALVLLDSASLRFASS